METDTESAGEEKKDKTNRRKSQKTNPWDRLMRSTYRDNQDQIDETVENTLQETPNTDVESEEMAYEELKPKYRSSLVSKYQDLVALGSALRKDPVHKVMSTAHRLRDEEEYDEEEAMQYAVKKRRYLLERKLDKYEIPSLTVEEETQG